MNQVQEILASFTAKDRNEFRAFLARKRNTKGRKDVDLLRKLSPDRYSEKALESQKGKDAYHSLRKRLMGQIAEFIVLKQMNEDLSETGVLLGWISLSRYLFDKGMHVQGWKYILRAEKLALETERYDILQSVYLLMTEYIHTQTTYNPEEIFLRQRECRKLSEQDERLSQATALIRTEMNKIKVSSDITNFPAFVEHTIRRFELDDVLLSRPLHMFRLIEIVRSTYLAARDLTNFEPLILEHYQRFEKVSENKRHHHFYRLQFLYMIAHALYHNRKFAMCGQYLSVMEHEMKRFGGHFEKQFKAKYLSLLCSMWSFSGKNKNSIEVMEQVLAQKSNKFSLSDFLNLKLNLAFYYFMSDEFKKANRIFVDFGQHSHLYYEKKMGQEWTLRMRMIHLIIQYELGNEDISLSMIRSLEKDFEDMLNQKQYLKAKSFLQFLRVYMKDPYSISFPEFHEKALVELFVVPAGTEESKAIAFYCWLKSKLLQRNYYEVFLEEVNSRSVR